MRTPPASDSNVPDGTTVYLNGRFVPVRLARVSVFDRSFLYGDGLFETILVRGGTPLFWQQHVDRLFRGAAVLGIGMPLDVASITHVAIELIRRNRVRQGVLRVVLSRGVGPRGYSPQRARKPVLAMTVQTLKRQSVRRSQGLTLVTSSFRVPENDGLGGLKTCNKLLQVMAMAEAERAGADEALLLSAHGWVAEASAANLFWIEGSTLLTPPLSCGILPGITRALVMGLAGRMGLEVKECRCRLTRLLRADGVFLTSSIGGIRPVARLEGQGLRHSAVIERIREAYLRTQRVDKAPRRRL